MRKVLLYCKKTLDNFAEFEKEYIGVITDDNLALVVEGEMGQKLTFEVAIENGKPYYLNPQYKEHFYRVRQLEPLEYIELDVYYPDPKNPIYVKC